MAGLKVATFNVWHGLAGRGNLRFREFETRDERRARFKNGLRCLLELDPDVVLFQELNPVVEQGAVIKNTLGGRFVGRIDQSGVKFFGYGLPQNLSTGLGMSLRGRLRPARLRDDLAATGWVIPEAVRLSGSWGFSGETMSFHLSEQRYAQFQSVVHETMGRLLVVNTHLHHGFERFPELMSLLEEAVGSGRVAQGDYKKLLKALDRARDRRLSEVDRILEVVHSAAKSHDGILLGGDLNSTPEGFAYRSILNDGFVDLAMGGGGTPEPTWDPVANKKNHRLQREKGFDFPLPDFGNRALLEVYRMFDTKPRRIDFLFAKGVLANLVPSKFERFGFPDSSDDSSAPSDHFGLMATYK